MIRKRRVGALQITSGGTQLLSGGALRLRVLLEVLDGPAGLLELIVSLRRRCAPCEPRNSEQGREEGNEF
jgi:hypothetical protein